MKVCRVEFKKNTKRYFFNPNGLDIKIGDKVVVETVRGVELAYVTDVDFEVDDSLRDDIKPLLRFPTKKDLSLYEQNIKEHDETLMKTKQIVRDNKLDMKLLDVEYTLDRQKLMIYYEADERVDFRQLVKDLAFVFHTRIEMRQIGPRDSAKLLGGLGPCGLIMCCKQFISDFDNVSIKMAKNQNLSLNPQKISGTCGKLLCCIKYENETYEFLRQNMPDVNDFIILETGKAKVISVDVLKQEVKAKMVEDEGFVNVKLADIKGIESRKGNKQ